MNSTLRYLAFAFVLLAVAACGGGSGPCGGPEQQCCGWPAATCNNGLSCQRGACRSCGTEGGPCCSFNTCNPNLFCNSPPGGPSFVCQACGHVGQPACVNNTCVTGVFSGGRCVAGGSDEAMCNGSTSFLMGIRDGRSHCRMAEFTVRANSLDDARICAVRAARTAGYVEPEASDSAAWREYPFRTIGSLGCDVVHMPAYTEEDGEFCARYIFTDRTVERGDICP